MSLNISKIIRILCKDRITSKSNAHLWLPKSLTHVCNCTVFCKFTRKGNIGMPIIVYNHNYQPTTIRKNKIIYRHAKNPNSF